MNLSEIFNYAEIKNQLKIGLFNWYNFKGKTNRKDFVQFAVGITVLIIVATMITSVLRIKTLEALVNLASLISFFPCLAIVFRRFNDLNRNAIGYVSIFFTSVICAILLAIFERNINREIQYFLEHLIFATFCLVHCIYN